MPLGGGCRSENENENENEEMEHGDPEGSK
jgi:hypothetical protein